MPYHFNQQLFLRDGQAWPNGALSLPVMADWRDVNGFEAKQLCSIGDLVADLVPTNVSAVQSKSLPVYMQAIESRFAIQNRANVSCTARAYLVFIPNLNKQTDDAIDYLRPDIHMLGRLGTGNMQFDGWMKKELNSNATTPSAARKFTVLDHKKIYLPPTRSSGQYAQSAGLIVPVPALTTKKFTLRKYYKGFGRKHQLKSANTTGDPFTDGTYYFLLWTDHAPGVTYSYINATTCKFRVGTTDVAVNA